MFYLLLRQRQNMSGDGAERKGDTESETGSRLWAVSTEPDAGLGLTNCEITTWAEVGRSLTEPPGCPNSICLWRASIITLIKFIQPYFPPQIFLSGQMSTRYNNSKCWPLLTLLVRPRMLFSSHKFNSIKILLSIYFVWNCIKLYF